MKSILRMSMLIMLSATMIVSCKKNGGNDDDDKKVEATPIKTLSVVTVDGTDSYTFTYDDKKRVSKIDNYWNDILDKTILYNYSVAGKLSITSGSNSPTMYEMNAAGLVTKELWSEDEWAAYEYDANGYMIKVVEHWDGADHLKMEAVINNGNIMKHTNYTDDGTVSRIKEFTYTAGDNVNEIHQASMIDHNTKPIGGIFGKPSKKILQSLTYWDPRENPVSQRTTTMTYEFDAQNRPTKWTRTLYDGNQEVYTYSY